MRWVSKLLLVMGCAAWVPAVWAQELNCRVDLQLPTVQGIDRNITNQMQRDIANYMNTRRWTSDNFDPNEKIKCSLTIIVRTANNNRFEGECQLQVIRPVYGGSYETVVLNFLDRSFKVFYDPFQQFNISETQYQNNLLSLLDFYGTIMVGFDYDSFSPSGGLPFFQRALNILNLAQNSGEEGWKSSDGNRNRYWLVENLLNNSYQAIHKIYYDYHRRCLDQMGTDPKTARDALTSALADLQKLFTLNPGIYIIRVFLDTKINELALIYRTATPEQKRKFLDYMNQIDPSNMNVYDDVLEAAGGE